MPKNKKPAGGRPAKNFDPRYAAKKSGVKAGSRSPGHRGYRADASADSAPTGKKPRWTAADRTARTTGTGDDRRSYGDRPVRGERPARGGRPAQGGRPLRGERPNWEPREDRQAGRRFERFEPRAPRDSDARQPRRDSDERAPRRDSDERQTRRDPVERAPRREYGEDRPRREYGESARRDNRSDRPGRSYGDRPSHGRGSASSSRGDGPRRRDFENRAPRTERRESSFYPSRDSASSKPSQHDDIVLERLEAEAIQASEVEGVTFGDLGLGGNVVRTLADLGAATPFPIQAATIPDVLAGKDVLGRGRTGSGKTIAFGAPLVERLMQQWADQGKSGGKRQFGRAPRALIVAPTRELALQIDRTVQPIARSVGLFTTQIYGGVPQGRQVGALQRGVDIVIGTPGRIEDLVQQGKLDLSQVVVTVLDEADHMCDLGFLEPVQRILRLTADGGQKLLFSATLDKGVAALVDEFLESPAVHEVAGEDQASGTIDHRVLVIDHRDKAAIIEQLARRGGKTLVFSRTRAYAEQLADLLEDADIPAVSLHGDLNQARRTRNLEKLSNGRVSVLVATDVAARGIHVDDIDLVIQADAPDEYKSYLHRSGRTGRAGKPGTVVTLVTRQRRRRMGELLQRAEIEASFEDAAPGSPALDALATV